MYTKIDLFENKKMNEIIRQNKLRVREEQKKKQKKDRMFDALLSILATLAFVGLIYLLALIEAARF